MENLISTEVGNETVMATAKIAVVFDTNSYRQLVMGQSTEMVKAKIKTIREQEAAKGIEAFGILIVGMEMLNNLVEGDKGFNYEAVSMV